MSGRKAKVLTSAHFYFLQCSDKYIKEQQVDSQTNMKLLTETLNQSKMMKRKASKFPPKSKTTESQAS